MVRVTFPSARGSDPFSLITVPPPEEALVFPLQAPRLRSSALIKAAPVRKTRILFFIIKLLKKNMLSHTR
jgi:hypothetical protein